MRDSSPSLKRRLSVKTMRAKSSYNYVRLDLAIRARYRSSDHNNPIIEATKVMRSNIPSEAYGLFVP